MLMRVVVLLLGSLAATSQVQADPAGPAPTPRTALAAFNDLIGTWRGTGQPEGSREVKQKGFWLETVQWEWKFRGSDAWLQVAIDKGKYFSGGQLRYLPSEDRYQLTLETPDKKSLIFSGPFADRKLTLDRVDPQTKERQRLVFHFLHDNRYVYRYEVQPPERTTFSRVYQVGATKEGVPFASGDGKPECIVSGGLGTMRVMYKGQTYYVCCSGCRDAFNDEPEKYIREFEEKQAKAAKKKP